MLTNFLIILKDLVDKNCVLQSFYPGYIPDLNAGIIKKWPALTVWFETLVGRKQDNKTRMFEMTCEFLVLQGYFNDNTVDEAYKGELYKVRKWDELQKVADAFFSDLHKIALQTTSTNSDFQFILSDTSTGTRFSRSSWLNAQSGSQYKANQANSRFISVMQTFNVAFPIRLCNDLCCACDGDYKFPPMEDTDPKKLVKPFELKC